MFSRDDPAAVEALTQLHQQFVIASSVTNLVFWLVLGMTAVVAVKRVTRPYLNAELTPQSAG
jgi:predicted cobalt transporter CbtA